MRVATWNLENLFRPGGGPGAARTQADYEAKLAALAETITTINPDVMGVQEVGSEDAFNDLLELLGNGWYSVLAHASSEGANHPIRVGALGRVELELVEEVTDYAPGVAAVTVDDEGTRSSKLSRPVLHVRAELEGGPLEMLVCHFKSKLLSFPRGFQPDDEDQRARYGTYALGRRAAEAATTRITANRLTAARGQQRRVLVVGDLNDTEYSATTALLAGPGGSEIGAGGFDRPDPGDGDRLWNLGLAIDPAKRFTRTYQHRPELIDHLFASHALLQNLGEVTSVDVGAHSVTDQPAATSGRPPSDHRPLRADLNPQPLPP